MSHPGDGQRVIDLGGVPDDEEAAYDGPVLVVFAVDPGVTTGWAALKIPVGLLAGAEVSRVLARCRYRYGQVARSGATKASGGGGAYASGDSRHVTEVLRTAMEVYDEWCLIDSGEVDEDGDIVWVQDEDVQFCFAMEGFELRESSMDPSLLAPVRVASIFMDRLEQAESHTRVFFQSASDAKRVVTDERLRRWGVYNRASGAHSRDATRHAILLLRRFAGFREIRSALFGFDPLGADPLEAGE